jgi:hypothetical protein
VERILLNIDWTTIQITTKKKDTVKLFRDLRPKYKIAQSEVEGGVAGCQGASH